METNNDHIWQSFASESNSLNKLFTPLNNRLASCSIKPPHQDFIIKKIANQEDIFEAIDLKLGSGSNNDQYFLTQDYCLDDGSLVKLKVSECHALQDQLEEQINHALHSKGVFIVQL